MNNNSDMDRESSGICNFPGCNRQIWELSNEKFCIFHSENNGENDKVARQIWEEAREQAKNGNPFYDGWHFPEDPDKKDFCSISFNKKAIFDKANFEWDVNFQNSVFIGQANFIDTIFGNRSVFNNCRFNDGVDFRGATFNGRTTFLKANFDGIINFTTSRFMKGAFFRKSVFERNPHFIATRFGGEAYFRRACFKEGADFRRAKFTDETDFSAIKSDGEVVFTLPSNDEEYAALPPFLERPEYGASAYRLAKQTAQDQGNYRKASNYHYAEQCAIEYAKRHSFKLKPYHKDFWLYDNPKQFISNWFEFLFYRLLFGYGEKPHRILVAWIVVIISFTFLYWVSGGVVLQDINLERSNGFFNCLYFSVVTFTTLGYGDFHPVGWSRIFAGIEALSGAILMALFVVALTRKYMR